MTDFDELLPAFVEESQQHLQVIEPDLLALEKSGENVDPDTVNRIFRGVHSIKGASGFFGFQNIGRLSHVMENSLSLLRDGRIPLTTPFIDALLSGVDALKSMLEDISGSESFDIDAEIGFLKGLIDKNAEARKTVAVSPKPADHQTTPTVPGRFHVPQSEIRRMVETGQNLYAVKIYLDKDLRKRGRTPYDFINNMEINGEFIDSFLDVESVSGLSDCLENELAFDFLFASDLTPGTVRHALDLPGGRVTEIDLGAVGGGRDKGTEGQRDKGTKGQRDKGAGADAETASAKPGKKEPEERGRGYGQAGEKIRVGVNFLNELVNLAGELVLGRNQLLQAALPLVKSTPGLNPVLQHISRVTTEMQEKIMQMRMQPLAMVFDKFQRVVRDLAKKHDKEIRLVASGGEVELDKTIIEGLSDPLTHLVRNAVDHGIESPRDREKAGKPRYGTITLKAFHQGGQVHLTIADDGRGVDPDFVAQKAVEKGIVSREAAAAMSPRDRIRLIFRPGFSTSDKITDLSGRGVGMDVVLTNIEAMGGTADIESAPGQGSTVTLVLPLTLAIVSGLMIASGGQNFILPEVDIDELVRVKPDEIGERIDVVQNAWVLRLRDVLLPLVDLNRLLGLTESGVETDLTGRDDPLRIIVVKQGGFRFGLVVDRIVNTEEIVVKPLPRYLKRMACFSGVSILGNGKVSLILDVAGIVKKAAIRRLETPDDEGARAGEREEDAVTAEVQTLLIFDNDTPERFALPLELISRIEKVSASRIERIKDKQFLQYQGEKLRLVFLEDYLPVTRPERSPDDTIGLIVPKGMAHPMGIVFKEVINTTTAAVELDTASIMAPGLFGATVIDDRITLLPDMYRLFEMAAPEWYRTEPASGGAEKKAPRILLAEDTPFFRMVEKDYLVSAGYEVLVAENGRQALQILEEAPVDAVVLDIVMPKMTGWDVIAAIRSDPRLKRLPVMAVTSLGNEGDLSVVEKGYEAGFDEWELKLNKTRLLEKLAGLLTSPSPEGGRP